MIQRQKILAGALVQLALLVFFMPSLRADSALPLIGGFDSERIDAVYPPDNEESVGELAKLVFRLRSVDPRFLQEKVGDDAKELGDAINVDGEITKIVGMRVPEKLVEFLEMDRLEVIDVQSGESRFRVLTTGVPDEAKPGDRISGVAVLIETNSAEASVSRVVAAPKVGWHPASPVNVGWKMLSEEGVDVSALASVATRNHKPLMAEDGDAFYALLSAAANVSARDEIPPAIEVEPVSLLQKPKQYGGQWMHMELETVQVTRIAVTEPHRQQQLGTDHYFQIDAVGDLGNFVVQIERADGEEGPPARFENRYPVSLVVRELPEFLRQQIRDREGGDAMVAEITIPIEVDGFFFRLWSYSTEYMTQYGGADQFGPLLVAARIQDRSLSQEPAKVSVIGWIAALGILSAILGIWAWNHRLAKRDREVQAKRRQTESEHVRLPDEAF